MNEMGMAGIWDSNPHGARAARIIPVPVVLSLPALRDVIGAIGSVRLRRPRGALRRPGRPSRRPRRCHVGGRRRTVFALPLRPEGLGISGDGDGASTTSEKANENIFF